MDVEVVLTNTADNYATEFDALKTAGAHVGTYDPSASLYIHAKAILSSTHTTLTSDYIGSTPW